MLLKEVFPPQTIEYKYDFNYTYSSNSNLDQNIDVSPFVYPTDEEGIKRLVLIWEIHIFDKAVNTDILILKLEYSYIIDCNYKPEEKKERITTILSHSCQFLSTYYKFLNVVHPVRLKELEKYFSGLEHRAEELFQIL